MRPLIALFIRRPVFTWVSMLSLVVLGAVGFGALPLERFPSVDIPFVSVTTLAPGLSPDQTERDVTARVENALGTIGGLSRLDSSSQPGVSVVMASFVLSKNADVAAQEVRDRLARIADELPAAARAPVVETIDFNASPILQLALYSPGRSRDRVALSELAEGLVRRRLQTIAGVGDIRLIGSAPRTMSIDLDPLRLAARGLVAAEVADAVSRALQELPGGEQMEGPTLRTFRLAPVEATREGVEALVVGAQGSSAVTLGQVATVGEDPASPSSIASYSGQTAVSIAVLKRSGANTVEVARAVTAELGALRDALPGDVRLDVVADDSEVVSASLAAVEEHLIVGAILAALVVLLFLRDTRATVISALAIPVSVIGTFAAVRALGMTLNMMTLLGLTLAVGIVIDDAIVVLENVVRVLNKGGRSVVEATLEATEEIALAVLATTLSLVAVFLPVTFMDGIVGRFLAPFGLTMAVSILLSMAVAFTLTPMLCARWLSASSAAHAEHEAQETALDRAYLGLLTWSLRHRGWVAVGLVTTVLSAVPLLAVTPTTFLPVEDEARFVVYLRFGEGTAAPETARLGERLATEVRALPGVAATLLDVGSPRGTGRGPNEAVLRVNLAERGWVAQTSARLRGEVAPRIMPPDALLMVSSGDDISGAAGPDGATVQLVLRGPDPTRLEAFAAQLLERARAIPGTLDHATTSAGRRRELRLEVDAARAQALGVDRAALSAAATFVDERGVPVGSIREPGRTLSTELRMRLDAGELPLDEQLRFATVRGERGESYPLHLLAHTEPGVAEGAIRRTNRARQVTLALNTVPGTSDQAVVDRLRAEAAELRPDPSYTSEVIGNADELEKTTRAFGLAIVLSFVFMYLVLAAQFESWLHPVTILVSLPLTVPFALLSTWLGGQSLNLFSALGLLVLFGVVKKNAILQVDHTLALQREGLDRETAVLRANRDRLRPILMTTLAFVAGLVPMVISSGAGAATNRAVAVGILGGQTLSLVVTLIATPVVFTWLDDLRQAVAGWRAPRPAPVPRVVEG